MDPNRNRKAIKCYLQTIIKITRILKKNPKIPIQELLIEEVKICLAKIRQLKKKINPLTKEEIQWQELEEEALKARIEPDCTLKWTDIKGLDRVIYHVRCVVELIHENPELLQSTVKAPRNILLYGPPGCGKSFLIPFGQSKG